MSFDSAKDVEIEGVFSGGFVDNTPESTLSDKYSPYLRNVRLDGMAAESRPGHVLHATLTAGDYPRGMGSYLRANPSNDKIVIRHNQGTTKKLVTVDSAATIVEIDTSTNIASDNRMTFQNIGDVIYCMNGSDDFGKLNGTTYSEPSTGIASFSPSFSAVFNGSHWASGWATVPNKVYKSVGDNYEDFASAGSDSFTFQETITSLIVNSEALFYFTSNTISVTGVSDIQDIGGSINYTTRGLKVKEGAVNHYSTIAAGNNIYAVTPSNKIIQVTKGQNIDGFEVFELSEKPYSGISKLMSSLDKDQTDCFGYFLPKENIIKWFFKTNGSTFNDICIIYDITKSAFLVDDNKFFNDGVFFKGLNYTISNIEPKVFIDEYGYTDEDAIIEFYYETKNFDLGIPTRKKELWEARTYIAMNDLAVFKQEILIDGNTIDTKILTGDDLPVMLNGIGTKAIGTYAVGTGGGFTGEDTMYQKDVIRTRGNLQVKGKKIKFIYTNTGLAGRVRLEGLGMRVEVLPGLADDLT